MSRASERQREREAEMARRRTARGAQRQQFMEQRKQGAQTAYLERQATRAGQRGVGAMGQEAIRMGVSPTAFAARQQQYMTQQAELDMRRRELEVPLDVARAEVEGELGKARIGAGADVEAARLEAGAERFGAITGLLGTGIGAFQKFMTEASRRQFEAKQSELERASGAKTEQERREHEADLLEREYRLKGEMESRRYLPGGPGFYDLSQGLGTKYVDGKEVYFDPEQGKWVPLPGQE